VYNVALAPQRLIILLNNPQTSLSDTFCLPVRPSCSSLLDFPLTRRLSPALASNDPKIKVQNIIECLGEPIQNAYKETVRRFFEILSH
jgi:hypothetical protein